MIIVRKLLDFVFTKRELKILDDILPKSTRPLSKEKELKAKKKGNGDGEDNEKSGSGNGNGGGGHLNNVF